jgi:hypothetical protein
MVKNDYPDKASFLRSIIKIVVGIIIGKETRKKIISKGIGLFPAGIVLDHFIILSLDLIVCLEVLCGTPSARSVTFKFPLIDRLSTI